MPSSTKRFKDSLDRWWISGQAQRNYKISLDYLLPESKKYLSSDTDVSKRHTGRTPWWSSGSYSTTGDTGLIPVRELRSHMPTQSSHKFYLKKKIKRYRGQSG